MAWVLTHDGAGRLCEVALATGMLSAVHRYDNLVSGAVAQLVAHLHGMEGVRGSNPLSSTRFFVFLLTWIKDAGPSTRISAGPHSSTIPAMVRSGAAAHLIDHHPETTIDRDWTAMAIHRLEADSRRSADTHLVKLPLPGLVDLYLKDESTHPTGSLKHRLARSLFLYALCNGWIGPTTTVVEASSGSTAVSEAYFARLIGVPFVAVMSRATSPAKIALIKREGGGCHLI